MSTVEKTPAYPPQEYVGGVRWRHINATWPLARLTISPDGLAIRPSSLRLRRFLILLKFPILDVRWTEVDRVEERRGLLPMSFGVSFVIGGKDLIWWCRKSDISDALIRDISLYIPEKIVHRERRRVAF